MMAPSTASPQNLFGASRLGHGSSVNSECFSIVDIFYVWKENREENKTIETAKQLVKLAGNKLDSVILILKGSF